MFRRNREILYALVAIAVVTAAYSLVVRNEGVLPAASGLIGHSLGIVGMLLMLVTEVAYSLRKRSSLARWGSNASWLRAHVVTGLVGPYMVVLHTAMRFRGLAAAATVVTGVVVISGIVGRYIYTSVPRTARLADAPGAWKTEDQPTARDPLATWRALHVPLTWALFALAFAHVVAALYYGVLQR